MFLDSKPPARGRLKREDTFAFRCHKDLGCFNTCCREKHLPLSPYDVLRLKQSLQLDSDEFLVRHTVYRIDPGSGFPVVSIKMVQNPERTCPFVTQNGCSVYADRPAACRLFPLGRFARPGTTHPEAVYYLLDVPGCLGTRVEKTWRVREWEKDQGLEPFLAMDDRMLRIYFHPGRTRGRPLSDRQLQMIFVAAYSVDVFREFVFGTDFLNRYPVPPSTQEEIATDDLQLLQVGLAYLERALFTG